MVLNSVGRRLLDTFANRIFACYVIGSHADKTAVAGSDLDLVVVFNKCVREGEKEKLEAVCNVLSQELSITIDLEILDEQDLGTLFDPMLKLGSLLLFGLDIRDKLPPINIEDWARDRLHTSYWRTVNLFGRSSKVTLPLNYPSPESPFFGYVVSGNTRNLLRHVSWAATALIAYQGHTFVVRKADFYKVYRTVINDGFSDYLENLYQKCKIEWNYEIPENEAELQNLCRQTLIFENHFADIYRSFLVNELESVSLSAQLNAVTLQVQQPLMDETIKAALMHLKNHAVGELNAKATVALEAMDKT